MTFEQKNRLAYLDEMRRNGSIGEEEYQRERNRVFEYGTSSLQSNSSYLVLMHLAQFAGFFVAGLGFAVPIILWAIKKDQDEEIDRHGRNLINFIISYFIYAVVLIVATVLFAIGIVTIPLAIVCGILLIALAIAQVLFIVIASMKAGNNEYWQYPMCIPFFHIP